MKVTVKIPVVDADGNELLISFDVDLKEAYSGVHPNVLILFPETDIRVSDDVLSETIYFPRPRKEDDNES